MNRANAKREATKHGAAISVMNEKRSMNVFADLPAGRVWKANGYHSLVESTAKGDREWTAAMYSELIERMRMGTGVCDDEWCETCREERGKP